MVIGWGSGDGYIGGGKTGVFRPSNFSHIKILYFILLV